MKIRRMHMYYGKVSVGDFGTRLCDGIQKTVKKPTRRGDDFIMCGRCFDAMLLRLVQVGRAEA